jgi:hypothetical protein
MCIVRLQLARATFKMGIDARLHYDKGGKVCELMVELLDSTGMRGVMSVAKYEGSDSVESLIEHFFNTPSWGEKAINISVGGKNHGESDYEGLLENEELICHMPIDMFEDHDLVGWAAVMETKGP